MKAVKTVLLQYTDVVDNNNKYYRLTLYDNGRVLAEYGRVGVENPSKHVYDGGIAKFDEIVRDKTRPGRKHQYKIVDTGGGEVTVDAIVDRSNPVHSFINAIFKASGQSIKGWYDGDVNQVSLRQIQSGRSVLTMIQRSMSAVSPSKHRLNALLSEYYSTIPHKLGRDIRNIADEWDKDKVSDEFGFLQELEDAVKTKVGQSGTMSIEDMLTSLGVGATLSDGLARDTVRKMVEKKSSDAHGVVAKAGEVFEISHPDTRGRFDKCPLAEKRMLFHGSGTQNFVGLLSRGFLVKPRGVYHTGSMFGNGIYFADVSTKSTQYCTRDGRWPMFLILAEVKLGNIYRSRKSMPDANGPPRGYDSVMGVQGWTESWGYHSGLLHNEFIVYDPAQTYIRYVAEVTTHHRR